MALVFITNSTHRVVIRVIFCIMDCNCTAVVAYSCPEGVKENHVTILRNHISDHLPAGTLTKKIHSEIRFFHHWTAAG